MKIKKTLLILAGLTITGIGCRPYPAKIHQTNIADWRTQEVRKFYDRMLSSKTEAKELFHTVEREEKGNMYLQAMYSPEGKIRMLRDGSEYRGSHEAIIIKIAPEKYWTKYLICDGLDGHVDRACAYDNEAELDISNPDSLTHLLIGAVREANKDLDKSQ